MADWQDRMWRSVNRRLRARSALRPAAAKVARRATEISRENGGAATYTLREGIRPGGRYFVDVVSDSPEEERGTETVPRINALRRAVRGG